MPNEVILPNGFVAQSNSNITGTLATSDAINTPEIRDVNGVLAMYIKDDRILYDETGNPKLIFESDNTGSGALSGQLIGAWNVVNPTDSSSVLIYSQFSALFISASGGTVGIGNGIVEAELGFEADGGLGFLDIRQTMGTVAVWGKDLPSMSSSIVLTDELTVLSGINTGSNLQTQLNNKQAKLVTGSSYPITASWSNNALTASSINFTPPNASTASFFSGSFITASVVKASYIANQSASVLLSGSTVKIIRGPTVDNCLVWGWENPGTSSQNFYVKAGMLHPDVTRWGFAPCDINGTSSFSWGFEFMSNGNTGLQGFNNNSSINLDSTGQMDIYGNNGINFHNGNVVIDNELLVNGLFNPAGGIYDTANGVIAIQIEDDRQLFDESGNSKLDFHSTGTLFGQWIISSGGITGSITTASLAQSIIPNTWSALTAASAVTWSAANNVYQDRRTLVVNGATTMSIQNLYNGWEGSLKITNKNTGSSLLITPNPKVSNSGSGSISLTNISASIDFLGLQYDGTTLFVAVGNNFN